MSAIPNFIDLPEESLDPYHEQFTARTLTSSDYSAFRALRLGAPKGLYWLWDTGHICNLTPTK